MIDKEVRKHKQDVLKCQAAIDVLGRVLGRAFFDPYWENCAEAISMEENRLRTALSDPYALKRIFRRKET